VKILLQHAGEEWYTIVRAEHDGREWWVEVGPNTYAFRMSAWLSPEACIEGTADEMRALAAAIDCYSGVMFKRCAVQHTTAGVFFWSPRNSHRKTLVPFHDALDFAAQVFQQLGRPADEEKV
jgi:hypothetical protein